MQVTLKKPHIHAGQQKQPGEVIEVTEAQAVWLKANGVIEIPPAADAPAADTANSKKGK